MVGFGGIRTDPDPASPSIMGTGGYIFYRMTYLYLCVCLHVDVLQDFHCLRGGEPLYESELHEAVKETNQRDRHSTDSPHYMALRFSLSGNPPPPSIKSRMFFLVGFFSTYRIAWFRTLYRIRIQGSSGTESVIAIRITGLKKNYKMLNYHKIILLFTTFQVTSFDEKIL